MKAERQNNVHAERLLERIADIPMATRTNVDAHGALTRRPMLTFAIEVERWRVRPLFGVSGVPEDGSTVDGRLRFACSEQDDRSWWRWSAVLPVRREAR